jgi:hypothetical protein
MQSRRSRFVQCLRVSHQEDRKVPVQELAESVMPLGSEGERIELGGIRSDF